METDLFSGPSCLRRKILSQTCSEYPPRRRGCSHGECPPEGHTHGATDNPRPTGGRAQAAEDAERHQRGDRHDECGLRRW